VDLTLAAEHRRGHGAMYEALNHGSMHVPRLRQVLAGLPMPRAADGRLVLGSTSAIGCALTRQRHPLRRGDHIGLARGSVASSAKLQECPHRIVPA
jgi:hypothetical protein